MSNFKVTIDSYMPTNMNLRVKITLIISFVLLFITSRLSSQTLEEREKQIAARNHIKTKIQTDFNYQAGKIAKTGIKTSVTTYTSSGDILQISFFNSKGQNIGTETYTYDQNNNRTLFEREGSGNNYKKISEFNARNNLILETGFNGTENFRNEYSYNSSGKLLEVSYIVNNRVQQKLIYENSGNITNVSNYMAGTTLTSKIRMVYDNKGQIVEETTYSIDGRELGKKAYKYTTSSQLVEETKTQKGSMYYRITYSYDSRGNLLSIYEETLSKKNYAKKLYSYDAAGNLVEYKWRRNPDEEFNVKTYTYNSQGICLTEHTFYPNTKFELLSKFEYEFY